MNVSPYSSPTKSSFRSFIGSNDQHTFLGVGMKPNYTTLNLLAIPFLYFTIAIVASFTNTQMIFILRDEEYYGISRENIGSISNDVMFYMILATTVLSIPFGYIFDIFGRRKTLFLCIFIAALLMSLIPIVSPNVYPGLILIRIGIGIVMIAPNCNPLVTDYVRFRHRGKATAYQNMGQLIGELFTYGVLFSITNALNYSYSFMIVGGLVGLCSLALYFMIQEPNMRRINKASISSITEINDSLEEKLTSEKVSQSDQNFVDNSKMGHFKTLTRSVCQACRENIVLPICFVGVFVTKLSLILYNTFFLLWLTNFVDSGVLESDLAAKNIVQGIKIYLVIASFIFIRFAGEATDSYPAYKLIPIVFIIKGLCIVGFIFIKDPNSILFYSVCILIQLGTLFQNIQIDSLFAKNLRKDIRGTLNGVQYFFSSLGMMLFTKFGGMLYDQVGPEVPYLIVAGLDILFGVFIVVMFLTKKFLV